MSTIDFSAGLLRLWRAPEAAEKVTGEKSSYKKPWHYRRPDGVRDEVLARQLPHNQQRADGKLTPLKAASKPRAKREKEAQSAEPFDAPEGES